MTLYTLDWEELSQLSAGERRSAVRHLVSDLRTIRIKMRERLMMHGDVLGARVDTDVGTIWLRKHEIA